MPESADSEYPEAIQVVVDGKVVGSLSREHAPVYWPGLLRLMESSGRSVALKGTIVGRPDGSTLVVTLIADAAQASHPQILEMFLHHDPSDFGVTPQELRRANLRVEGFRTGWSQAAYTDRADDRYDLSWFNEILRDASTAIERLRAMLGSEQDPIDRHYMMCELESRLYRARGDSPCALDEYDAVCRQHDAEMDATIRPALLEKFGVLPLIDMYRQESIRWQKANDWKQARDWAERGIAVYGDDALPEFVDDLRKRVSRATQKIAGPVVIPKRPRMPRARTIRASGLPELETLVCASCGTSFERPRTRGRKPHNCPACRGVAAPEELVREGSLSQ